MPLQTFRLLDTMTGVGAPKGVVAARSVTAVQVGGRGSVPATGVGAVVINITARSAPVAGAVTVFPHGGRRPGFGQLRFGVTAPSASLVTVPVGSGGMIDLYNASTATVHLAADVVGYYVGGTPEASGMFRAVAPTKVYDTRSALGTQGVTGPVTEKSSVVMLLGGRPPLPNDGVSAVLLNVTATGATAAGSLVVHGKATRPNALSLKYPAVAPVTQQVVVPIDAYGQVFISNQSMTKVHVALELLGWFTKSTLLDDVPPADVTGAVRSFDPVTVYRSTGVAPDPAGATRTLKVLGRGGVPASGVSAVHVVLTAVNGTAPGALAAYPSGSRAPSVSNLFFRPGVGASNSAIVPVGPDGSISIANRSAGSTQILVAVDGYVRQHQVSIRAISSVDSTIDQVQQVECPTSTFCIALDRFGNAARFDGTSWGQAVATGVAEGSLSCASTTFCMVVGYGSYNLFVGDTWSSSRAAPLRENFDDVDCVAPSHCVGLTAGSARVFDGGVWGAPTALFPTARSIDCPSATSCIAVGSGALYARLENGTWTTPSIDATSFVGSVKVSFGAPSSCMALSGNELWRFNGAAWSQPFLFTTGFRTLQSVSCVSASACVLLDDQEAITFDAGVQGATVGVPALNANVLSCASASWCMVVARWDWAAPLSGGVFGVVSPLFSRGAPSGISCPTPSWCMAVTSQFARRFVAPDWGNFQALPTLSLPSFRGYTAVSCSSTQFCLAVGDNGGSAQWDGTSWSAHEESGYGTYTSVACPVDGFCVAGTGGFYSVYDHGTWTRATLGANYGSDVTDCLSTTWCRMLTSNGAGFVFDGSSFVASSSPGFPATAIDCVSTTWCMATGGSSGTGQAARFDGVSWTTMAVPFIPSSLSCTSSSACVAVDDDGQLATFDGAAWTMRPLMTGVTLARQFRVACLQAGQCMVTLG